MTLLAQMKFYAEQIVHKRMSDCNVPAALVMDEYPEFSARGLLEGVNEPTSFRHRLLELRFGI
jgi:hypothetical protein